MQTDFAEYLAMTGRITKDINMKDVQTKDQLQRKLGEYDYPQKVRDKITKIMQHPQKTKQQLPGQIKTQRAKLKTLQRQYKQTQNTDYLLQARQAQRNIQGMKELQTRIKTTLKAMPKYAEYFINRKTKAGYTTITVYKNQEGKYAKTKTAKAYLKRWRQKHETTPNLDTTPKTS